LARARHILLTGLPGCGKTTVAMAALALLRESGVATFGFWTQEIREGGERRGFALELVSGGRDVLASVDLVAPRVGKYGVNVEAMQRLVVPEIERAIAAARTGARAVIVMDEIGKMELFSRSFQQVVVSALDSPAWVLATVMLRPHPFADSLKARSDVQVVTVTAENRSGLAERILEQLLAEV